MTLHPLVAEAAEGRLPPWAAAGESRRRHMARVADLLGQWAETLGLDADDTARWRSIGWLHDVLREVDPETLRDRVPPALRDLPGAVLHGPAAAERLRAEGVEDGELLRAVAYHTIGDPGLRRMGRALYVADFLEPGRSFLADWRASLRERMPSELEPVAAAVVAARVKNLIDKGSPVLHRTIDFWNTLAGAAR